MKDNALMIWLIDKIKQTWNKKLSRELKMTQKMNKKILNNNWIMESWKLNYELDEKEILNSS